MRKARRSHHLNLLNIRLALCLCIFFVNTAISQDAAAEYGDSLFNSAEKASTNELKIEGLLKVSIFWSDRDTSKAYFYLDKARRQMGKSPNDFQMGLYHLYRANILMEYNAPLAKSEYLIADKLLARNSSSYSYSYRSKLWNNYCVILQTEDKGDEFMKTIVSKTLPYARLAGDSAAVAYQLQNMGLQLENIQDFAKANEYFKAALQTLRTLPESYENKLEIFSNAARNALFLRNFGQAKRYIDSARYYVQIIPHSTFVPAFYRTELTYFRHTKNKQEAIQSYHKGLSAAEKLGNEYMQTDLNFEVHALYRDLGEYSKAKKYLLLVMSRIPFPNLKNNALYYRAMAYLEYQLGNYKSAYQQMDSLTITLDSIYSKDMAAKILNLEQQYKATEKENRILRLEAENRQQELVIAKNRWWKLALGGGLIFTLCIAFFLSKINRNNKRMLSQKDLLHQEEIRSVRQQERLKQYEAVLQGQETERNRLARDLHDGLGGLLSGTKLKMSSIAVKSNGNIAKTNEVINEVIHQLDYSVDELRRIAQNLMPESLRHGGLVPALSDLCRYMDTTNVPVKFQSLDLKDNYPEHIRITVYRIVQELLTNAVKHADARKIILQGSEMDGWLFITVEDNGKGIGPLENFHPKGLGIANIRNRVALLNGNIEIQSHDGEGTTFNIQIPI